jgi:hypothetical protein
MPATAAFCTISRLTRPLTEQDDVVQRQQSAEDRPAHELVERVVPPDVLAHGEQPPIRLEQSGGMEPAGRLEHALGLAQRCGQADDHGAIDQWSTGGDRIAADRDPSSEALPQIPQLAVATVALGDRRSIERAHGRTTIVSSGWASAAASPVSTESTSSFPISPRCGGTRRPARPRTPAFAS